MLFSPYILQLIDQWSQHTIRLPHLSYPLSINTHNSMSYWPWAIVTIKNYNNNNIQASEQQLQEAVSSAGRWLQDWHLLVNVEKTVTMLFHHDNRPPERLPTIYLQNHLLNVARKQRHLGIVFQHDLRWAEHINTILIKSLTSLKNLLRLRNSLNSSALSYLYRTYIPGKTQTWVRMHCPKPPAHTHPRQTRALPT